jgi:hypothetical protein
LGLQIYASAAAAGSAAAAATAAGVVVLGGIVYLIINGIPYRMGKDSERRKNMTPEERRWDEWAEHQKEVHPNWLPPGGTDNYKDCLEWCEETYKHNECDKRKCEDKCEAYFKPPRGWKKPPWWAR